MVSQDDVASGQGATHDEIVVALPHVREVFDLLSAHRPEDIGSDARLGLVRVRLTPDPEALTPFREAIAAARQGGAGAVPDAPLDVLLCGLRYLGAEKWTGWYPVVGKNRDAKLGGEGWPYTITGGGTFPGPVRGLVDPYRDVTDADRGSGDVGRVVGLVDTGVDTTVVKNVTLLTPDSETPRGDLTYRQAHGTFLAGLVNQYAPEAQIHARAVLEGADAVATSWDVAVGLMDVMETVEGRRPDVVVLALGCVTADGEAPLVLQRAVDLVRRQCVLATASGNHGDAGRVSTSGVTPTTPMWPAALDGVTTVGSETADGVTSTFTPRTPWVDFLSPGEGLRSVFPQRPVSVPTDGGTQQTLDFTGSQATWSGTSMAAAIAAGRIVCTMRRDETAHDALARIRSNGTAFLRAVTGW